jgi:cytosolic prostaglandin-E synthase
LIPRVLWAQRKDIVYITFEVFEVTEEIIEINENVVKFSGIRSSDGAKLAVTLELFESVDAEKSKINVGHREVSLVLAKSEAGPYWPRLLKSAHKMHFIHTDFSKWVDEDEEEEIQEPEGMGNFGNFDMNQFGGLGSNFDMSRFGGEENVDDEEEDISDEGQHECEEEDCSHANTEHDVKISGLTKNSESFNS